MKAMILAAGLGTRLLPLTEKRPKPLFPILDRPLIDVLIRRLQSAGCDAIIINTHHIADMIDQFVQARTYDIPVVTRYESTILGTGGAIKNVEDFWNDDPFLVINGDIFTNIDLEEVYRFHRNHKHPATLVLHDVPQFNHVWVDTTDHIRGFGHTGPCPPSHAKHLEVPSQGSRTIAKRRYSAIPTEDNGIPVKGMEGRREAVFLAPDIELSSAHKSRQATAADYRKLAFTGIQVLDPLVLSFIPEDSFFSIIDAYCEMIDKGLTIKGFIARNHYWHDIGTIAGYQGATREALAQKAFQTAFPEVGSESVAWSELKGDGSDRTWYRVTQGTDSLIVVDHGPRAESEVCEPDAFAYIGKHLHDKGVPVPRIFAYDRPSGLVVLEDLGDLNLQSLVQRSVDIEEVADYYRAVIDLLVLMGVQGVKGFDLGYTYQTPYYDRELILEKESRYFVEAFLNGYLGRNIDFESFEDEFDLLAQRALEHPYTGFLHRDFQSRNILVRHGKYYVIDFQGARLGPLQYDLASLLIDPYVKLSQGTHCFNITQKAFPVSSRSIRMRSFMPINTAQSIGTYRYWELLPF
jgi:NDP-sugar pyrophosphorylase family protein